MNNAPLVSAGLKTICCMAALLCSASLQAHDARPLSVTIMEQAAGIYRIVVRAPPALDTNQAPRVVWPASCELQETTPLPTALGVTSLISCPEGLAGQSISIEYPFANPSITTLFRLESRQGISNTAVLPPDVLTWVVPAKPNRATVAREYTQLGFWHIWNGVDHLLFVAGLLLLAKRPAKIVYAITGFTLAHSLTLSLATLGLIRLSINTVEALIALSILFLAVEIARPDSTSFSHRYPVVLSFVFGLLHGFGFASALAEISLPGNELVIGLLCFNLGVELGQFAFIAVVLSGILVWSRCNRHLLTVHFATSMQPGAQVCAYCLGIPAAYWFIERTVNAFTS